MRAVFLRVFLFLSVFTSILILSAPLLQAVEPVFVRESLRARGMGNAFTATANDEMLLFYNPAGLRSVSYNIYEVVGFNFTTNQSTQDLVNSSSGSATLGNLAGKKIYAEVNLGILSHINSRFGWSLLSGGLLDTKSETLFFHILR